MGNPLEAESCGADVFETSADKPGQLVKSRSVFKNIDAYPTRFCALAHTGENFRCLIHRFLTVTIMFDTVQTLFDLAAKLFLRCFFA